MSKKKSTRAIKKNDEILPVTKKTNNFHIEFLNEHQRKAWQTIEQNEITFLIGPAGSAKSFISSAYACSSILTKKQQKILLTRPIVEAVQSIGFLPGCQPLTQKVLTPTGWTTMGEIKIGDKVIGRDGMPTEVLGIYPKGEKDTYKVTTFDGTSTICCADHLWYTQTKEEKNKNQQGKVRVTRDIISDLENGIKHFIPRNEPVHFDKKEVLIAPYTLGVLLVDVNYSDSHVRFESADIEAYRKGAKPEKLVKCTLNTLANRICSGATVAGLKCEKNGEPWMHKISRYLEYYDLYGKKSCDKFIPDDYKYSSVQDRIDILRGLLDAGASVKPGREIVFHTTSLRLAEDVIEIVRSLGGNAKLRGMNKRNEENRTVKVRRISYEVSITMPESINPFYLVRKAKRFVGKNVSHIEIISIEKVGHEKVQCIKVDNPEHLYLTDNFIVTHNTFEEKVNPYITPIYDALDELVGPVGLQRELINKSIQIRPLNYMRGCNFNDAICLHDEAQNNDFKSMLLYITRLGRNSKMIINGDPYQCDIRNSALMDVINKLEGLQGIGVVRFNKSSIVRNPLISQILSRLAPDQDI